MQKPFKITLVDETDPSKGAYVENVPTDPVEWLEACGVTLYVEIKRMWDMLPSGKESFGGWVRDLKHQSLIPADILPAFMRAWEEDRQGSD